MSEQLAEMQRIADNPEPPTFATPSRRWNDRARCSTACRGLQRLVAANTNPTLQRTDVAMAPRLAAHHDAMLLNPKLFARVKRIYDTRATLSLEPEDRAWSSTPTVTSCAPARSCPKADKTTLRALNQEESKLTTSFRTSCWPPRTPRAGVRQRRGARRPVGGDIAAAASAAEARGLDGKWVLPLQNTTQQPALASLKNRALRERLFKASTRAATTAAPTTRRAIIARLAQLRAERAKLLGFPTYAAYRARRPDGEDAGRRR